PATAARRGGVPARRAPPRPWHAAPRWPGSTTPSSPPPPRTSRRWKGWRSGNPDITALSPGHKANLRHRAVSSPGGHRAEPALCSPAGAEAAGPEPLAEKLDDFLLAARRRAGEGVDSEAGNLGMGNMYVIEDISLQELKECEPQHDDSKKIAEFPISKEEHRHLRQ
ncbi:unnamed protein product, partial [Prorocentrum cordatum]